MEIFKIIKEAVEMGNEALEKEIKLQTLTGYPIDVLIDLFAKGYTLKCPEIISERSIEKMADRYKEGYNDCNKDWENKIKEKIHRLKYETKYIGGCNNDCKKCFSQYRGANFVYCYAYHQIKGLQDLLKKG